MHDLNTIRRLNDDAVIKALREDAEEHGDDKLVSMCNRALDGDELARRRCLDIIDDVEAERAASDEPVFQNSEALRWASAN